MVTALGIVSSNLEIQNIDVIDKASYTGNVILEKFDGTLFEQKELGTVSLNFDVDGKALKRNFLILQYGDISQIEYKNYNYTNIVVNGTLKS
jgi:hypothetical protein